MGIKYNINIDNRDIVSMICINEITKLIPHCDFTQDRQILKDMIDYCNTQINIGKPMRLINIFACNCNNYCDTCSSI